MHSFQHKHIVKTVAFDNSSEHLVTGSNEKLIRVFNLQSANSGLCHFVGWLLLHRK